MAYNYDFSGYATRNDIECSDGRTIRRDAFKECDGKTVPLVWMHRHDDPDNVIGHALLENLDDGVYAYCSFNDSERAKSSKMLVEHGDITSLSIYANQLKQRGGNVLHGVIREVSLVLAGANPGACIVNSNLAHSEDYEDGDALIYPGEMMSEIELYHADDTDTESEESEEKTVAKEKTIKEIYDSMTEEQQQATMAMIGLALENANADEDDDDEDDGDEAEHSGLEDDNEMKHNVFDYEGGSNVTSLTHSDYQAIFADAKRCGSLKDAVQSRIEDGTLIHSIDTTGMEVPEGDPPTYGFHSPDFLFPEARALNNPPEWIKRDTGWVTELMSGTHHTPFSRIKSVFANITEDEARAKGYLKAHQKKDEVFTLLRRTTDPQTIYKRQKMDRDDVIDITDFDVVAWIKGEMRMMLDEEIARAVLIGDGRSPASEDHISEDHIRPIYNDAPLFTVKRTMKEADYATSDLLYKEFIKECIRARKDYKGTGSPILFTTEEVLTEMLLLEDGIGHPLYASEAALATKLRVRKIVTVPVMENFKDAAGNLVLGIIVNPADYNIGADKGGAISLFDDFDIDYNQQKYLIETRCSGALIKPYSAITVSMTPKTTTEEP